MVKQFLSLTHDLSLKRTASILALVLVLSIGFTSLMAITSEMTLANHTQCSDGVDNDNDSRIDYPQDDDCESLDDDFEGAGLTGNFITVTDGKEKVQPGEAVVYVITLKQQRQDARVVNLELHLPHQANIVSATDGGAVTPSRVRWTNVSVYKNVTRTLSVNVNVRPDAAVGEYIVARALVDGSEATDTSLIETYVPPPSDQYSVSITDGKEYSIPAQNLNYTIRVRNNSSLDTTTDVRVAMPYLTTFQSASDGGIRDGYNVTWKKVNFKPKEQKTFTFTTLLDHDATNKYVVRARAYAGTVSAVDQTIVSVGLPYDAITTTLSDNRNTAEIGQILTYAIKVTNTSDVVGTHVAVSGGFPVYGQFVSATEGGFTDGNNVRWLILQIAPKETRTLQYSVRIRPDAPLGTVLTASAVADGANGAISRDTTKVVHQSDEVGYVPDSIIFRKTADRSEAVPGGSIRYTLYIKNTLDHVISDASIVDRYDSRYMTFASTDMARYLTAETAGHMEWSIPVLKPGESWQATYVLSVSEDAPAGMELDNVATLRGADVSGISLTERVRTNTSGVLGDFPTTGVGMDGLLAFATAGMAFLTAGAQRKLRTGSLLSII